jgi:hypothetical protein
MHQPFARTVRLGMPDAANGEAYVTLEGFFLGDGTPLIAVQLRKGGHGRAHLRPEIEIALLMEAAYGECPAAALSNGLGAVARALDAGDLPRAAIAAVHLGLPPVDDPAAFQRLAEANRLLKGFDPDEPRDERGRWTTGARASPAPSSATNSGDSGSAGSRDGNVVLAQEFLLARPPIIVPEDGIVEQFKETIPRVGGKEGAKGPPSWAEGQRPRVGESGKDFAQRLLDEKYGKGNYEKGPDSEFSKIQKWGDRSFRDPKGLSVTPYPYTPMLSSPDSIPPGTVI